MPISSAQHAFIAGTKLMTNQRKSKLTEPQVMTIFSLRPNNSDNRIVCTSTELAVYYKVSRESIKNIWNGRTWSDVTGGSPVRRMGRPPGVKDSKPRVSREAKRERLCAGRIDDQLFEWARTRFVLARLFTNDEIDNLE